MLILFQLACFSSSGSDHFNIRKINSKFSQRCLFRSSQVVFVFPSLPPFFFKDSDFLIGYPFYWWEVSPFFSVNVLIRWSLVKILTELWVHHSSLFSFSGGFNSSFRCWSYPFPHFKCFSTSVHLLIVHLSQFIIRSAQDILEDSCFHSQSVQAIWRLLSHSSHLIQPVPSLFSSNRSTVFLLSGP